MFCSTFEAELAHVIPVVKTSIGGTRIIGRLCIGKIFRIIYRLYFGLETEYIIML